MYKYKIKIKIQSTKSKFKYKSNIQNTKKIQKYKTKNTYIALEYSKPLQVVYLTRHSRENWDI